MTKWVPMARLACSACYEHSKQCGPCATAYEMRSTQTQKTFMVHTIILALGIVDRVKAHLAWGQLCRHGFWRLGLTIRSEELEQWLGGDFVVGDFGISGAENLRQHWYPNETSFIKYIMSAMKIFNKIILGKILKTCFKLILKNAQKISYFGAKFLQLVNRHGDIAQEAYMRAEESSTSSTLPCMGLPPPSLSSS